MTQRDKQKWDLRYSEGAYSQRLGPNEWLKHALAMAKIDGGQGRRALDAACGSGRNALCLAALARIVAQQEATDERSEVEA